VKQFKLQLGVLVLAAISSAQQSPAHGTSSGANPGGHGTSQTGFPTAQQELGPISATPPLPPYPDTAEGLERMMADMVSLQKRGDAAALTPYVQSLVLPDAKQWFTSNFGDLRCGEEHLAANDCLGPRLAFTYRSLARILPASFALTLTDLINEQLTSFEATNYTEPCPGPQRIIASQELVGGLTTTPVLSSMLSGLVQHHEPVYVLWSYSDTKETTLPFFVYSQGGFRYIGMPHPASPEDYQNKNAVVEGNTASPSARYLTEDQVDMQHVPIDPTVVQRSVMLRVSVGKDGKVTDVLYVRGPEAFKDAAMQSVRKKRFEPPGFGPHGFHGDSLCVNVAAPL
jgi:Gram-negative bacterial TonB protein C-terminal